MVLSRMQSKPSQSTSELFHVKWVKLVKENFLEIRAGVIQLSAVGLKMGVVRILSTGNIIIHSVRRMSFSPPEKENENRMGTFWSIQKKSVWNNTKKSYWKIIKGEREKNHNKKQLQHFFFRLHLRMYNGIYHTRIIHHHQYLMENIHQVYFSDVQALLSCNMHSYDAQPSVIRIQHSSQSWYHINQLSILRRP